MAKYQIHIDKFLVKEHDPSGRSLPVYFRIPPDFAAIIEKLFNSRDLPFQTKEEMYRWALCVGIQSLMRIKRFDFSSPLLHLPFKVYQSPEQIDVDEFFREVHKIIEDLSALGYRTPQLEEFIDVIEGLVRCLPSKHGRERYVSAFEMWRSRLLSAAKWPDHPSPEGYRAS